ncbi:MAG: sigma-E processing peptidase SpoIIGA, partial [Peptococcaceae bacterium]|nr:sigma-E processing peptidase SpoIIGA [Peptococcaceae bacterium]
DSGNCLKDPVNDMPVIVVELRYVRSLFSEEELRYLSTGSADAVLYVPTLSDRIRLLPYQTVGYRGLMLGVRLDSILIHSGNISSQQKPLSNVVMALNARQFGAEGTYQGIISPLFV